MAHDEQHATWRCARFDQCDPLRGHCALAACADQRVERALHRGTAGVARTADGAEYGRADAAAHHHRPIFQSDAWTGLAATTRQSVLVRNAPTLGACHRFDRRSWSDLCSAFVMRATT